MKHQLRAASFAVLATAAIAACSPPAEKPPETPPVAEAPTVAPFGDNAEVKSFTIGAFQAASMLDGGIGVPNDNKTLAINKTKKEVADLLTANGLSPDTIDLSVQAMMVRTPDKLYLFDAGAASLFGPTLGKLPVSIYSATVGPGDVTDIFISHSHADHVGGLVGGSGEIYFPNAAIHMSANEWTAMKANKDMAAIVTAITPKVVEFQPGADLVPGVKAVDIQGHTPGHSGYLVTSGDQSLLYIGDTMHHSVISVQRPDWTIQFDGDAPVAQASRKKVIEDSAASGQRIFAPHFPFPGLGKFVKKDADYVWQPE